MALLAAVDVVGTTVKAAVHEPGRWAKRAELGRPAVRPIVRATAGFTARGCLGAGLLAAELLERSERLEWPDPVATP